MRERIYCIKHEEKTPSLVVYDTHAHCFGGCGRIELSELGLTAPEAPKPRYKEDLAKKREYINALPVKEIRGLPFRYDSLGYYVCWPNSDYYKLRLFSPGDGPKYKNPSGHTQPVFWARRSTGQTLYVVEGEINALSLAEAVQYDIMSPGSASNFLALTSNDLTIYRSYANIIIMVDRDAAGTAAAIHLKGLLLGKVPFVSIVLMPKDCNQVLIDHGKEALKDEADRGLLQGLPRKATLERKVL